MEIRQTTIRTALAFAMCASLLSCGVDRAMGPSPARNLTYEDFIVRAASTDPTDEPSARAEAPAPVDQGGEMSPSEEGADEPRSADPLRPPAQVEPGQEVVVDSLVGQINGRPVYANAFFAPIDDRLRIAREQQSISQFETTLQSQIWQNLWQIMQSDVLLSEAEARLTPQQQQGLLAWLTRQREDVIARRGRGSAALAEENLRELEGEASGIASTVQSDRDRALIQMLLVEEVRPRVIVSWRDIERAYNADYATYNPPGSATIAWIYLYPGRDDQKIEMVKDQLASGVPFADVATAAGMRNGGLIAGTPRLGPNGFADAEGLRPEIRDRLVGVGEGEVVGPFPRDVEDGDDYVFWLHVVDIDQPPGRSIYDPEVQLAIRERLIAKEFQEEQDRYFRELFDEDINRDLNQIQSRLIEIARQRYVR